jgi:DNA helicase MCM8
VCENLKTPAALLSRFDLVFIVVDRPDEAHDRLISEHIMRTHRIAHQPHGSEATTHTHMPGTDNAQRASHGHGHLPLAAMDGCGDGDGEEAHQRTLSQRLRWVGATVSDAGAVVPAHVLRRYIEYAQATCHPTLSGQAAKILQKLYLTMRSESSLGNSLPVTTRHLESLIRLSQARARAELRDEVTAADASDVVQLLQESLLDAFTTEVGTMDFKGRKGGFSLAKQVKALVAALTKESNLRGSALFHKREIGK